MAVSPNDVVSQMRASLALSEPDLDTTIGTTTRKILDSVGEVVAEAYVDRYLLDYRYDIDSKAGGDLDDFITLFGFTRLIAKRATGSITFQRSAVSETESLIPRGTQVSTDDSIAVMVATLVPALMMRNDLTVTVPAQAVLGGSAGNIGANTLARAISPIEGVGSFTNSVSFTGGGEAESDAQLRTRFKRTIFRNLAGTESMYTGTALEDPDVSQVNVLGASKRFREQIQVIAGTATSTLVNPRYVYPNSTVFGTSIDSGAILVPDVHYTFDTTARTVTILGGLAPDGIYDLEYEYVSDASRNDPLNGVTNRVDLYCKGERAISAQETAIFRRTRPFDTTTGSPLNRTNFLRADSTLPTAGNYLIDLVFGPVMDVSVNNLLVINGITYTEGVHYFTVNDVTREGGTMKSLSGYEFVSAANGNALTIPADGVVFTSSYVYNAVPGDVEVAVRGWRLITTDVRVHTASKVLLNLNYALILDPGSVESSVRPNIEAALKALLNSIGFAGVVQVSDLLEAVTGVTGVDAARMLTDADNPTAFAVQRVSASGTVLQTYSTVTAGQPKRAVDIFLSDMQVPVFNSVALLIRAANSFGTV